MLLRTQIWFSDAWPARTMRIKTSTICQIRCKVTKQLSNYFGQFWKKCKKSSFFHEIGQNYSKIGRKLSDSGVIYARNDLLREVIGAYKKRRPLLIVSFSFPLYIVLCYFVLGAYFLTPVYSSTVFEVIVVVVLVLSVA